MKEVNYVMILNETTFSNLTMGSRERGIVCQLEAKLS
jgi:hypothetical protein